MIDHVSVAVRDLGRAVRFYDVVLAQLGLTRLETRTQTIGYGKRYPEFWLNHRPDMLAVELKTGAHVCLRSRSTQAVDAFFKAALTQGGSADDEPGLRPGYGEGYYGAFVRDPDGNRIEAVTFLR